MLYFSICGGMSTGLSSLFRELSIKDDKLALPSSDDTMVVRKKRRDPESVESQSNRKVPPVKRSHVFRKSIRRQLKKRGSGSFKRPSESSNDNKNNPYRPKSLSKNDSGSATSRGSTYRRRNSEGRDVASCPTWRQLTIQRSGTENEHRSPGRTRKLRSECGPVEMEVLVRSEPPDGKTEPEYARRKPYYGKSNRTRKNSPDENGNQASQISDSKQYVVKKKPRRISNQPRPSESTYPDVRLPSIVLIDCLKSSEKSPPKLRKSSLKNNKFRYVSDYDELSSQDSVDDDQPTRRRSGEPKPSFHVPTWRQLTKQQSGSSGSLNLSNEFESSSQSTEASGEAYTKYDSAPSAKYGERRKVPESDKQNLTVAPTWRQLTKLQSGSSEYQNRSEYVESDHRKTSTKNEESKIKRKRRPLEETFRNRKRATQQSADLDLLCRSNNSTENHRPTSSTKKTSKAYPLSKFELENQKSDVVVLPTWRQLSIMQSDVSSPREKSTGSCQKRKRSVGGDDSEDSISSIQELLPKAKPVTLTAANLKVPTIQISRADSQDTSLGCKKPKTPISARQEITCDNPKSSALRRTSSSEHKKKTFQEEIPTHIVAPESKPPASDATEAERLPPFPKITIPGEQGGKPHYECSMCDYKSNQLGLMWEHVKIHDAAVKPYACNECDYRAKTDQLLNSHKITHAGEKPYACDLCEQRFRIKTHLRLHQIVLHNGKPLACHECTFKTADEGLLQRHLAVHGSS